jgi:hypothetical protein
MTEIESHQQQLQFPSETPGCSGRLRRSGGTSMELCIYHGIKVHVEGLEGERISQMCRCTGSHNWRGGDRQNDWVWVKQRPGRCYAAQHGCLL